MGEEIAIVEEDGALVIPADVVRRLGCKPGHAVVLRTENGRLHIDPMTSIVEHTAGMCKPPPGHVPPTTEERRRLAEEAIAEDTLRRMGGR